MLAFETSTEFVEGIGHMHIPSGEKKSIVVNLHLEPTSKGERKTKTRGIASTVFVLTLALARFNRWLVSPFGR
jgi:hypothetical protein